jgi:hypothetical protein
MKSDINLKNCIYTNITHVAAAAVVVVAAAAAVNNNNNNKYEL